MRTVEKMEGIHQMNIILQANPKDNVATCTRELEQGEKISFGNTTLTVGQKIPVYHKIALANIGKGDQVIKYGQIIGLATQDIQQGDYVHIHNVESTRGRGDKKGR